MKKPKPIFVGSFRLDPWKYSKEDVFLDGKGKIYSQSIQIKDTTRSKDFKRMYGFCEEYLNKKRLKYNIQGFYKMGLVDVVEMLRRKNKKSISTNKLFKIYHLENQIAAIKDSVKERFRKYVLKNYYKEQDI